MSESHHHREPNRLIKASSPYLLQHAYNPVDWFEWGEEALNKARAEQKLLIVSIGYSACHWCHVMEKESFEDKDTADIMNNFYVSIKIDREERPDIDQIYMDAVQLMNGRGGWPLNVICLPDGRPVQGGTYFPNEQWNRLLLHVANFNRKEPEKVKEYADKLEQGIRGMSSLLEIKPEIGPITKEDILALYLGMESTFDRMEGGFDRAPKFPMPAVWEFLLGADRYFPGSEARKQTMLTLRKMALGGIYDPIAGGFARYSVDNKWFVPHFEKMLYDNVQLLSLYAKAYRNSGELLFKDVIEQTACWLIAEMQTPEGGFFSALDADSEGVEGKYYVWEYDELKLLFPEHVSWLSHLYGITPEGNWEHGMNILYAQTDKYAFANSVHQNDFVEIHDEVFRKMLEERNKRVRPGLDDKVLAGWNGLLMSGLANYLKASNDAAVKASLQALAAFVQTSLFQDGKLYRSWKQGQASIPAFLEDYAAVILGMIDAYEVLGDEELALFARSLCDLAIERFYHSQEGMFSFKAKDEEILITHRFETQDNVIPSSNAQMAMALLKLHYLFEDQDYLLKLDHMLAKVRPQVARFPVWHARWSEVMMLRYAEPRVVCCTGRDAESHARILQQPYHSHADVILFNPSSSSQIPVFQGRCSDETRFFICEGHQCLAPLDQSEEVLDYMSRN